MFFIGEEYQLDANWMFLAGIALLCFVLIRRYIKRRGRTATDPVFPPPRTFARDDRLCDAPVEVVRWQVEMHEIARDAKAELDSKMRALQVLLRDAAEQEARLRALLAESARLTEAREAR